MIFTSDEVTSENLWQITSRVTKKSLFTVTNVLFYFLHAISYLELTVPLQTIISPLLLRTVFSDLTLWRHHSWLFGVPDYFDRNKILSGYDLSHYQVPHCIRVFFYFCLICVYSSQFSIFILNYVPIVTFWILTYHKIWILLIIFCFIWSYWIIYFLTCLEVFWSVVS